MRCVFVLFDSLNRHHLGPYGCVTSHTPNFTRLARRSCTFDTSYVCSMPCIPARRDLHTGRPNFLHRSWGPLEPFDTSVFETLARNGVHTHIVTDHQHYWEDGGATYHNRYSTYDFVRGQEGDAWLPDVGGPDALRPRVPDYGRGRRAGGNERYYAQDLHNRTAWQDEDAMRPMNRTFDAGVSFLRENHRRDNWLLQVETFDPHEPFDAPAWAHDLAAEAFDAYNGPDFDWPIYDFASNQAPPEGVEQCRRNYAALLAACDQQLSRILDAFDTLHLWDDTALVVGTDHGFFLGERDVMGKVWCPWWDTLARTPFFVHDPRTPDADGQRRSALVQPSLDLAPTFLDMFGVTNGLPHATGYALGPVLADDTPVRQAAMFGLFGHGIHVTDGRHVLMLPPTPGSAMPPQFTLMPTQIRDFFPPETFAAGNVRMDGPLPFTRGAQVMRIENGPVLGIDLPPHPDRLRPLLYDLADDPGQLRPVEDPPVADRLKAQLVNLMREADAPPEQFARFGLNT